MKRANVSDIVPQSLVSDITDEDRAAYAKEKSLVEEHLEFIRAYQKKYEKEMRKSDPRYQWIAYGFRDIHFSDSKFEKITNNGRAFVDRFDNFFRPNHIGIYISGTCGTGKSYLAAMIANELADLGYSVYMNRISDAIEQFNDLKDKTMADRVNNRGFDLIILDDFGASRETDYQIERLLNLVDAIKIAQIPLIVTTNLSNGELVNETNIKLKRVYDRILEMCARFPPMTGVSKRIQEAKEISEQTRLMFDFDDSD